MKTKTFLVLAGVAAGIAVIHAMATTGASSKRGDLDGDGFVTVLDLTILSRWFGQLVDPGNPQMAKADLNGDGVIDAGDYSILLSLIEG